MPDLIFEFVGIDEDAKQRAVAIADSVRTVLFTDLVGHTEMMSRLGDEAGRAVLREHETHHPRSPQGARWHRGKNDGRRLHGSLRLCDEGRRMRHRPPARLRASARASRSPSASASTPANRSRKTATSSAPPSSSPPASPPTPKAAKSSSPTPSAGSAPAKASSSPTAATSSPRASRIQCG